MPSTIWNDTNRAARAIGTLVYAMNQERTAGYNFMPEGYCMGLASVWLSLRKKNSDFNYRADLQELHDAGWLPFQVQKTYDQKMASTDNNHWLATEAALLKVGMQKRVGSWQEQSGGIAPSPLYAMLEQGSNGIAGGNGLYIVGMRDHGKGAHAVAVINEPGGGWRLFDGNFGHFRVQGNSAFYGFLTNYLSNAGTQYPSRYPGGWTSMGVQG